MKLGIITLAVAVLFVVSFAFARSTPSTAALASVAPSAPVYDYPPVTFEAIANVTTLAPVVIIGKVPSKAPKLSESERAMRAPMHCGPMHDNAIGGANRDCVVRY